MKITFKSLFVSLSVITFFIFLDQAFKYLARLHLKSRDLVTIIPNFIDLVIVENKGVSFSFLSGLPDAVRVPLLTIIPFIVVIGLFVFMLKTWKEINLYEIFSYQMIIAGAVGNLIDRVFRKSVTDYMYFHFFDQGFFINNFADDIISIGFVILMLNAYILQKKTNKLAELNNEIV